MEAPRQTAAPPRGEIQEKKAVPSLMRSAFPYTSCYCEENVYCFLRKMRLLQTMEQKRLAADPAFASSPSLVASLFDEMFAVVVSSYQVPEESEAAYKWPTSLIIICTQDLSLSAAAGDKTTRRRLVEGGNNNNDDPFVRWDYHVISLLRKRDDRTWYVADFDTKIPPIGVEDDSSSSSSSSWIKSDLLVPFHRYFSQSFYPDEARDKHFTTQNVKLLKLKAAGNMFRLIPCDDYLKSLRSDRSHMVVSISSNGAPQYSKPPPAHALIGLSEDPLISAIFSQAAKKTKTAEGEEGPGGAIVCTSASKHPQLARNNLVSFINTCNKTAPGVVVGRDNVKSYLESLA